MQDTYEVLGGQNVDKTQVVGYCRKHKVYLTAQNIRDRNCTRKGKGRKCGAYEHSRYRDHKQRMRDIRKLKEQQGIPPWQKVEIRVDRNGKLLPKLKKKKGVM